MQLKSNRFPPFFKASLYLIFACPILRHLDTGVDHRMDHVQGVSLGTVPWVSVCLLSLVLYVFNVMRRINLRAQWLGAGLCIATEHMRRSRRGV